MATVGPGIPGSTMEALADGFACGQVGTIFITIDDGDGNNLVGPTTANIVQLECSDDNAANYRYLGVYPAENAVINWEGENLGGTVVVASEPILVSTAIPSAPPEAGPCEEWITAADVATCCSDPLSTENEDEYERVARLGELIAFEASGKRFSGLCGPVTVRPCGEECSCWGDVQWLAYPDGSSRPIWTGSEWNWHGQRHCGCSCLPRIRLSGFVQGINEVKIDGVVIPPSDYRVDRRRWLVRKNNGSWPACQNDSLDDDEPGTFSVSYWYGETPNDLAREAAAALACEFYTACNGGECKLPSGAVKIVRQNLTIERLQPLASMLHRGETGILAWDSFIDRYGGAKAKAMRSTFYAPGGRRHAPRFSLPTP